MRNSGILILLFLTVCFCSCSIVSLKSRNGKDARLEADSFDKLNGNYSNLAIDTIYKHKTLFNNFKIDSVHLQNNLLVELSATDQKTISIKLTDKNIVVDSLTIYGNYRRGYFKIKRQWVTRFIAGPLLWVLGDNLKYLGLTNENNLVIVNSGSSGVLLLTVFPIFAAGGGQFENEYPRSKK